MLMSVSAGFGWCGCVCAVGAVEFIRLCVRVTWCAGASVPWVYLGSPQVRRGNEKGGRIQ
jgi:hypothetical protein